MGKDAGGPAAPRDELARLKELTRWPARDPALFRQALTHPSFVNEHPEAVHNQRLEFLGDAVLGLVVADELYRRFPDQPEGELTRMRAAIVCTPTLAAAARRLRLGELLRLGQGEEASGGRERGSLLADAFEAVIGALFIEGGLELVADFVLRHLAPEFAAAARGSLVEDFKTSLQEESQRRFRSDPLYRVVAETGPDHNKSFTVEVLVQKTVMGTGQGKSKKEAEQAAARGALTKLGQKDD